ncbi:hypothetical protein SAMN05216316_2020 [Nitrosovibrio sp. Nv6]|nr:hypothetical protein SAMN05216316_2020 [Nitrosovibrio sp. Nv6]
MPLFSNTFINSHLARILAEKWDLTLVILLLPGNIIGILGYKPLIISRFCVSSDGDENKSSIINKL